MTTGTSAAQQSDAKTETSDKASDKTQGEKSATASTEKSTSTAVRRSDSRATAALVTPQGKTHIADTVVAKIAGFATKEIPGVHSMGRGLTRRIGALRAKVPGQTEALTQGVAVEVGEKQAAVDLDVVTWYGESIVEVSEAVRRNVIERIEAMTGLEVVEVNIHIDDIYVDDGSDDEPATARVQ